MNGKVLAGIGVVIIIILIGIFMMRSKTVEAPAEKTTIEEQGIIQPQAQEKSTLGGMTEWMNALSSGKQLSCTYTTGEGSSATEVKTNMEGKKYRSEVTTAGQQWISVSDGQTLYSWSPTQKQGMKMDMSCLDQFKSQAPAGSGNTAQYEKSPAEVLESQPNIRCEPGSGKADFSIPTDIQFTDQCAMMQQSMEMMKQYQNQTPPQGTPAAPNAPN